MCISLSGTDWSACAVYRHTSYFLTLAIEFGYSHTRLEKLHKKTVVYKFRLILLVKSCCQLPFVILCAQIFVKCLPYSFLEFA